MHDETPIEELEFAVVDVETTGLGSEARVIEVACVRLRGWRELARYQTLLDPQIPVPAESTAVSGIDSAMLAGAPKFAEIVGKLDALLEDAVFVAHNASFDLHYLSAERKRCGLSTWKGPVVDTLKLARNAVALPRYSLGALRRTLDLAPEPCHRALDDVLTTSALLGRLIEMLEPPPRTLEDLLRAQEPIPVPWDDVAQVGLPPAAAQALRAAGRGARILEIRYEGRGGERIYRIVPDRLERNGPLHYLQATLADGGERRTFRLDRIRAIAGAGESTEESGAPGDGASETPARE